MRAIRPPGIPGPPWLSAGNAVQLLRGPLRSGPCLVIDSPGSTVSPHATFSKGSCSLAVLIAGFLLTVITGPTMARTWHVRPDGAGDAPTIQAGLDSSSVGDTVLVACGTYYEHGLVMKSEVTLRSETGEADCAVIDGEGRGRIFVCNELARTTTIEGLTLTHGRVDIPEREPFGAGMCAWRASPRILRCRFVENSARWGGGIFLGYGCSPTLIGCEFSGNHVVQGIGGGLCIYAGCYPEIEDCVFRENSAWSGGGIYCCRGAYASIDNCVFEENETTHTGGAVYTEESIWLRQCSFLRNRAGTILVEAGGGAIYALTSAPRIERCVFIGNMVWNALGGKGGAVFAYSSSVEISHCTFYANAANESGAALYAVWGDRPSVDHCIFAGNTGTYVIACAGGADVDISCSDVFGNPEGDWESCVAGQSGLSGNFSADPLFCDPASGNLSLSAGSPCLPGYHPEGDDCFLIGALDLACGEPTATRALTWGLLKHTLSGVR